MKSKARKYSTNRTVPRAETSKRGISTPEVLRQIEADEETAEIRDKLEKDYLSDAPDFRNFKMRRAAAKKELG